MLVRPEQVRLAPSADEDAAVVCRVEFGGATTTVEARHGELVVAARVLGAADLVTGSRVVISIAGPVAAYAAE